MNDNFAGSSLQPQAQWKITLFGSLELHRADGTAVPLRGKKAGELLAWLALQAGIQMRREELAERCWPESEPQNQRTRLRQEILALRSLLGEDASALLEVTNDFLLLRTESLTTDTQQFELLLDAAKLPNPPSVQAEQITHALSLYRDDLLIEYPDAFIVRRESYVRRYEAALYDLTRLQRSLGENEEAVGSLQRLISHNPLLEEAHVDLMRLYAERGQPSEVRRQYLELKRVLREEMDSTPTEATRRLRDSLLESLTHSATPVASQDAREEAAVKSAGVSEAPLRNVEPTTDFRLRWAAGGAILLILSFLGWGWFRNKKSPVAFSAPLSRSAPAPALKVERGKERWSYIDQPGAGEKPNSEALASLVNRDGETFVTGIVQTEKEDIDFLTLKLSREGNLLWRRRFSSVGHDCDRPLSIALDRVGGIYVAGETYLPARPGNREGWYATLVHYGSGGQMLWFRHSPIQIARTMKAQVIADYHGGAVVAFTEAGKDRERIDFCRYSSEGRLIRQWAYPASRGRAAFIQMCDPDNGTFYACGTLTGKKNAASEADSDWVTFCYDMEGHLLWEKLCDGPAHSRDFPVALCCDRDLNVYVSGVFSSGHPDDGTASLCPAIAKYSSSGQLVWQRPYTPFQGDVEIFGMTFYEDSIATYGVSLTPARTYAPFALVYSKNGTLLRAQKAQLPTGFLSATARGAYLLADSRLLMIAEISPRPAVRFMEYSEIALLWSDDNGIDRNCYAFRPQSVENGWTGTSSVVVRQNDVFVSGRIPLAQDRSAFSVVCFPLLPTDFKKFGVSPQMNAARTPFLRLLERCHVYTSSEMARMRLLTALLKHAHYPSAPSPFVLHASLR